jgi:hypothetical protein
MERYIVAQTHCARCAAEVARLIAADVRRHAPRWPIAKETTWA